LNDKDLREWPLLDRRAKLKELVPSEHPFLFSEEFTGDAAAFFKACADHQLEGADSQGMRYAGSAFIALSSAERAEPSACYKIASSNAAQFLSCDSLMLSG